MSLSVSPTTAPSRSAASGACADPSAEPGTAPGRQRGRHMRWLLLGVIAVSIRAICGGEALAVGDSKAPLTAPNDVDCGSGRSNNNCFSPPTTNGHPCVNSVGHCQGTDPICVFEWVSTGSCGAGQCGAGGYCQCPAGRCGESCATTCGAGETCSSERCVPGGSVPNPDACAGVTCGPGEECRGGVCAATTAVGSCPVCPAGKVCSNGQCVDKRGGCMGRG